MRTDDGKISNESILGKLIDHIYNFKKQNNVTKVYVNKVCISCVNFFDLFTRF